MDNPALVMVLLLAVVVMGGYYYLRRAQGRDARATDEKDPPAS